MAIITTPVSAKGTLLVNMGQDPDTGRTLKGSHSINGLRAEADNTKLYNVATAYAACLQYPVTSVRKTEIVELENE